MGGGGGGGRVSGRDIGIVRINRQQPPAQAVQVNDSATAIKTLAYVTKGRRKKPQKHLIQTTKGVKTMHKWEKYGVQNTKFILQFQILSRRHVSSVSGNWTVHMSLTSGSAGDQYHNSFYTEKTTV